MRPLISIIVPVYKVEPYLRKCVDSILAQTYTNIEAILVDDGSPDGCPAICDEYAAKDRRVVVIHQRNAGLGAARNAGMDVAKGEYIAFVDSDDWIEPDMYELLYEAIKSTGADIAESSTCMGDDLPRQSRAREPVVFSREAAVTGILHGQREFLYVWRKLYAKGLADKMRFMLRTQGEDFVFSIEAIIRCRKMAYVDYPCYHYIIRGDSLSHSQGDYFWAQLTAEDRFYDLVADYDEGLAELAAKNVIEHDIHLSKEAEAIGKYPAEAHGKIVVHIRKYISRSIWKSFSYKEKCWLCLLSLGRRPFCFGRKVFRALKRLKVRI